MNKEIYNNKFAIVREVSDNYNKCITIADNNPQIDVSLAKVQHKAYCKTLEQLGLKLINIDADSALPDCCFVEDTALVYNNTAIITNIGNINRTPETTAVENILKTIKKLYKITPPATIDGGDVLRIENKVYVGVSDRTNPEGVEQLSDILSKQGIEVIGVKIKNTLHLKSVCTYLGNNTIIYAPNHFDIDIFKDYDKIVVPASEAYCANTLTINNNVIIPEGYPETKALINAKGFKTIELNMSEFKKGDGALTCLSIIF